MKYTCKNCGKEYRPVDGICPNNCDCGNKYFNVIDEGEEILYASTKETVAILGGLILMGIAMLVLILATFWRCL